MANVYTYNIASVQSHDSSSLGAGTAFISFFFFKKILSRTLISKDLPLFEGRAEQYERDAVLKMLNKSFLKQNLFTLNERDLLS